MPYKGRRELPEPALCGAQALSDERASFVHGSCGDNDIQACGLNDIFAVGKNDIALRATIFTLRVNGGRGRNIIACPVDCLCYNRGMKKRVILALLLVLVYLGWALSPLWKAAVYGYAPGCVISFLSYDSGPAGPAGKVDFMPSAFELSDGVEIGYGFTPWWGEDVDTRFTFDMPRYGNEHEVRMRINSDTRIVGAIAWDKQMVADPMTYGPSGLSPQAWAEAQGMEWLELSSGKENGWFR